MLAESLTVLTLLFAARLQCFTGYCPTADFVSRGVGRTLRSSLKFFERLELETVRYDSETRYETR